MVRERDLCFTLLSVSGIRKINVLIYSKVCFPDTGNITSKTRGLENWLGNSDKITEQILLHTVQEKRRQFSSYFTF